MPKMRSAVFNKPKSLLKIHCHKIATATPDRDGWQVIDRAEDRQAADIRVQQHGDYAKPKTIFNGIDASEKMTVIRKRVHGQRVAEEQSLW